jgi:hypothetical protein
MQKAKTQTMPQKGFEKASRLVERNCGEKMQRSSKKVSKMCSKNNARKFCKRKVRKSNSKSLKQSKKN